MPLPKSRKDREYQKFVDDGDGNVAVRAVVIGGGGGGTPGGDSGQLQYNNGGSFGGVSGISSDGDTFRLSFGTFLELIDKDENVLNFLGYLGELIFLGDLEFGNPILIGTGQISEGQQLLTYAQIDQEQYGFEIQLNDATDPEDPTQIEKYQEFYSRSGAEMKYENDVDSVPNGYTYVYRTNTNEVADDDILQTFTYSGFNDGLSEVDYSSTVHTIVDSTLGEEVGRTTWSVMSGGALLPVFSMSENSLKLENTTVLQIRNTADTADYPLAQVTDIGVDVIGLVGGYISVVPSLSVIAFASPGGGSANVNFDRQINVDGSTIFNQNFTALNSANENTAYGRISGRIVSNADGAEAGQVELSVMSGGTVVPAATLLPNGLVGLNVRVVTPDTTTVFAYLFVESSVGSGVFHPAICGGTTVPTDTEEGFTRGCQFTLATGGDAEIYYNLGDSTSCKFRKVTTS